MYARVSTFEGMMSDHVDEAVRVAREQFIPAAQQSGGFEGMYISSPSARAARPCRSLSGPQGKPCKRAKNKPIVLVRKQRTTPKEG
jgi:hypothetical protein